MDAQVGNGDGEEIRAALRARGRVGRGVAFLGGDRPGGRRHATGRHDGVSIVYDPKGVLAGLLDAYGRSKATKGSSGSGVGHA